MWGLRLVGEYQFSGKDVMEGTDFEDAIASRYGGNSMGNIISIGQNAGVAAALCAQLNIQPRHLDYRLTQEKLDQMGVNL